MGGKREPGQGGWHRGGAEGESSEWISQAAAPGEQGGNFQGPLVLTEEWAGRLVVREVCLHEGFGPGQR